MQWYDSENTFFLVNRTEDEYQNMHIFPDSSTQDLLRKNFKILIARSIVNFIPAFKFLRKNVCWHIKHPFTEEMNQKSEVVSKINQMK